MQPVRILLVATFTSLLVGQLIRFPIFAGTGAVTPTDILVFATDLFFLTYALFIKKKLIFPRRVIIPALLFIFYALSSLILQANNFSFSQMIISAAFLFRFFIYFLLFIVIHNIIARKEISGWLSLMLFIGFVFAILGFVQFVIFRDLTFLAYYGWDPHQRRIVSTLLDPNFTGAIFAILAAFSTSFYLYKKRNSYLILTAVFFLAVILTFSRSSYLALLVAMATIGFLKSPRVLVITIAIFLLAFLTVDQVRTRIIGALTFDETSRARLESWQNALTIFADNPIFGVGFNTYRFTQARYNLFPQDEAFGGHSGSGTDSSILLVAATTGIIGLALYLFLIISLCAIFFKKAKSDFLNLASISSLVGLVVHSQFVNSLFFPQIMLLIWTLVGLNLKNDT